MSGNSAFITYSDTLFGKNLIDKLPISSDEVLIVIDSLWKKRYADRTKKDIANAETIIISNEEVEFTGLVYLNEQSMDILRNVQKNDDVESVGNNFQDLFNFLELKGIKINYVDVLGDWAEFNSTQDITNFIIGTKADTLSRLENIVRESNIGAQINFTVKQWLSSPASIIGKIQKKFGKTKLVVRSSSAAEDNWNSSNAGGFESILDVSSSNKIELSSAIDSVANSYGSSRDTSDQILIQEFLQDVSMAGVVLLAVLKMAPHIIDLILMIHQNLLNL